MPAAAQEASLPGCCRSSTTTLSFSAASSKAIEQPMIPPPTIATSNRSTSSMLAANRRGDSSGAGHSVHQRAVGQALKRIDELGGKQAGLLGEVLSAGPVAALAGVKRLREEAANLADKVLLSGVELLALGGLQIFCRDGNIVIRLALVAGLIDGRKLRRNLGRGRARRRLRGSFGDRLLDRLARGPGGRNRVRRRRGFQRDLGGALGASTGGVASVSGAMVMGRSASEGAGMGAVVTGADA